MKLKYGAYEYEGSRAVNPKSAIVLTRGDDTRPETCIVIWTDKDTGEQYKRDVDRSYAFTLMKRLKADGELNISAILPEDDFITKEDIRELREWIRTKEDKTVSRDSADGPFDVNDIVQPEERKINFREFL